LPMQAMPKADIGSPWALAMFGVGLLASGYAPALVGRTLAADESSHHLRRTLGLGAVAFVALSAGLAAATGLAAQLSPATLVAFVLYSAAAAYAHELIVGLAAMHSGWFPAFAVALITLLVGMLLGFPADALAVLTGFSAATGPAFADLGYDLKTGFLLRGLGADPAFERAGRWQQFLAATLAFGLALLVVALSWRGYFAQDLVPPVARVYAATIQAGVAPGVASSLLLWALPGGLLQLAGGSTRQLGVLLSTGLLVANPVAGWGVAAGLAVRLGWARWRPEGTAPLDVVAAGFIAGDALWSFGDAVTRAPGASGGGR
jgi:uncharacterized oligopeptide transporter (OPT) family protein